MKNELIVSSLTCSYQDNTVIENVDITIHGGEVTALLGLNGCGKTTLLKALNSLIIPKSGTCFINEQNIYTLNEKQRACFVSYIPQRLSNIKGITVFDVVLMGFNPVLNIFETPDNKQKQSADAALDKLGIIHLKNRMFNTLSEGQKQLVIFARTLVQDTPIILMDEPDSALDFVNKKMILSKIKDIVHEKDKACLITLHDPNFALAYSDRILLLKDKKIAGEIKPSDSEEIIKEQLTSVYGQVTLLKSDISYVIAPQ